MTAPADLYALAVRLERAGPLDEAALVCEASDILAKEMRPADRARLRAWRDAGAFAEAAMQIYRAALPDCGFQFGMPPPLAGSPSRAVALAWRRGDEFATPYRAETPALALLRAAVHETARAHDAETLAACPTCHGIGWYVAADGNKQMCQHGRGAR